MKPWQQKAHDVIAKMCLDHHDDLAFRYEIFTTACGELFIKVYQTGYDTPIFQGTLNDMKRTLNDMKRTLNDMKRTLNDMELEYPKTS